MKAIFLLPVTLLVLAATATDGDGEKFTLSVEDTKKAETDHRDTFGTDVGKSNGPFRHVGGLVVEASQLQCVDVRTADGVEILFPRIEAPGSHVRVEFFVDRNGHSRAVLHRRKPDVEPEVPRRDERPYEHIQMSSAAAWAVSNGNTALLRSLMQAGLAVNIPLEVETGWTALHLAALHNEPAVVRMLLRNGANRMLHCSNGGDRPIDLAYEDGAKEVCQLLALPGAKEDMIAGYPESLWDELLARDSEPDDEIRFLSLNDQDPPPELLKYCQRMRRHTRARSAAAEATAEQREQEKGTTDFRDKTTKEYGSILEIDLKEEKDGSCKWSIRKATGPQLAGGGSRGTITKHYGYWIKENEQSWDE